MSGNAYCACQDRENDVLEAYRIAGIPARSVSLTTIAISTLHILIIAAVFVFTTPLLFDLARPDSMGLFFLDVLLTALYSEAIGAAPSCLVKKQSTMALVSQCMFLPSIMFSGIMIPASLLPELMQQTGKALPATQGAMLFSGDNLQTCPLVHL